MTKEVQITVLCPKAASTTGCSAQKKELTAVFTAAGAIEDFTAARLQTIETRLKAEFPSAESVKVTVAPASIELTVAMIFADFSYADSAEARLKGFSLEQLGDKFGVTVESTVSTSQLDPCTKTCPFIGSSGTCGLASDLPCNHFDLIGCDCSGCCASDATPPDICEYPTEWDVATKKCEINCTAAEMDLLASDEGSGSEGSGNEGSGNEGSGIEEVYTPPVQ